MKQYIKDGKIYNTPIKIKENGFIKIINDEEKLKEYGYEVYIPVIPKKTLEELIFESDELINKQTDERILNNFVWKEQEFYLTTENQTNFANMYIARDLLTYPQTIKTKTGYFELEDDVAVSGFYLAGINFVKQCLEDGWRQKAEAEAEIRKNYK